MTKHDSSTEIELSTIYFFDGDPPSELVLWDLTVPTVVKTSRAFCGLHGHNAKRDGFMVARDHAAKYRLNFTIVDVAVRIEAMPFSQRLKISDLAEHDFISLLNVSKEVSQAVAQNLRGQLKQIGEDEAQADDGALPLLARRPDLAPALMASAEWKHVRLMVMPANLTFSPRPLNIGVVPQWHWSHVIEASCRLDPTILVKLK